MKCRIDWSCDLPKNPRLPKTAIQQVVDAALQGEDLGACQLTVVLVDNAESGALHAQHFGDAQPTDVMSFPNGARDPASRRHCLGDLVISVDVARAEARARGVSVGDEILLYVVHGLLHLLGYDDHSPEDRAAMWREQARLLQLVGRALRGPQDALSAPDGVG